MSMSLDDARRIALDTADTHATVTLDCAAMVLRRENEHALRQLADIKACLQRGHFSVAMIIGN